MALLIATGLTDWIPDEDIRADLLRIAPDADIRTAETLGDESEITMMAVASMTPGLPDRLPNLQLVQKLGAGVETIVNHPALPSHVRVTRLKPDAPAREIAEFCLAYILWRQRNMAFHEAAQRDCAWRSIAPREADKTTVGVLGMGHIGGRTAGMLRDIGFNVIGWSRSPKTLEGVECRHGLDALPEMLGQCDYVAAILPSTAETRGLLDAGMLANMKSGSMLINAGRGDLVDEPALMACLDNGPLEHAVLDVVSQEPLPADNPLWTNPKVTITPHVSGWHLGDAMKDVVENYKRLSTGDALLHEVDRARGY
ncbi:MAG: 2-hydroxyacid dehydrogenase [Paracoccaceae bacterium]